MLRRGYQTGKTLTPPSPGVPGEGVSSQDCYVQVIGRGVRIAEGDVYAVAGDAQLLAARCRRADRPAAAIKYRPLGANVCAVVEKDIRAVARIEIEIAVLALAAFRRDDLDRPRVPRI